MGLLYGVRISAEVSFRFITIHAFDRQTGGNLVDNTALHCLWVFHKVYACSSLQQVRGV